VLFLGGLSGGSPVLFLSGASLVLFLGGLLLCPCGSGGSAVCLAVRARLPPPVPSSPGSGPCLPGRSGSGALCFGSGRSVSWASFLWFLGSPAHPRRRVGLALGPCLCLWPLLFVALGRRGGPSGRIFRLLAGPFCPDWPGSILSLGLRLAGFRLRGRPWSAWWPRISLPVAFCR